MSELDTSKEVFALGLVQFLVNLYGGGYTIWHIVNDILKGVNISDIISFVFGLAIMYIVSIIMNRVPNLVSKSDGRGLMHSVFGVVAVVVTACIITSVLSQSMQQLRIPSFQLLLFYSISIPVIMHLITDIFTPFGASLLHPLTPTAFSVVKDESVTLDFHKALYRIGVVLLILAWLYR